MPSRPRLLPRRADISAFLNIPALAAAAILMAAAGAGSAVSETKPPADDVMDLSGAVPLDQISKLPSTADQARALRERIEAERPAVETAKANSDRLAREADELQRKMIAAAAQVEALEIEKIQLDAAIADLTRQNDGLSAAFARDRAAATHLVAVLERLHSGMPPAMVLKSDDVLAAAHGTMILASSLPSVYGRAADLARRIHRIKTVRQSLIARRHDAGRNTLRLASARVAMNRLLARKQVQAAGAAFAYGDLKKKLDQASAEAANLNALLNRIAEMRSAPAMQGVGMADSQADGAPPPMLHPVAGTITRGGPDGVGGAAAPGITYTSISGAQVLAPVEGKVRFAGLYPKNGFVLILETANGYDAVLAGLGRLDVRLGERILSGEPVGNLPLADGRAPKLYFELRHDGQAMSPAGYIEAGSRKAKRS